MLRRLTYAIMLFGTLVLASSSHAETKAEDSKNETQPAVEVTKKSVPNDVNKKIPLKEFTPSEEISIDKPVAFPVDI